MPAAQYPRAFLCGPPAVARTSRAYNNGIMDSEAARKILKIGFTETQIDRMNYLADLARQGQLDAEQRKEIEGYNRIGHLLAALHSQAQRALNSEEEQ